ncbi:MAG: hypothetical protein GDA43_13545 [Hormoscilla sp. SP5CHS1]|nr:hypothetical protein [Hormoscilla sp. SP5CHS1]
MEKIIRWLLFKVTVPLVPFLVKAMTMVAKGSSIGLDNISPKGELSLVCVAIAAEEVGSLFFESAEKNRLIKLFCGGLTIVLLIISCLWFPYVSTDNSYDPSIVSYF